MLTLLTPAFNESENLPRRAWLAAAMERLVWTGSDRRGRPFPTAQSTWWNG